MGHWENENWEFWDTFLYGFENIYMLYGWGTSYTTFEFYNSLYKIGSCAYQKNISE